MRFKINRIDNKNGPSIFGYRLKEQLELMQDWEYSEGFPEYNLCFSVGNYIDGAINILRLDGLYFDTENTLGDTTRMNACIKNAYAKFDGVIFQTEFSRIMYCGHFGYPSAPSTIIHNGAPVEFTKGYSYTYPWRGKTLMCSSHWRAHKRLDAVVAGFMELNDPDTGLVIIGKADKSYDNDKNIMHVPDTQPKDIPFLLRGADAFVHLAWLDWCPNVVVEALTARLPVLCSHNGGTKELVGDDGIVLKLEDDYDFKSVALYDPPKPDPVTVAQGMRDILSREWDIHRPDLRIENVARQYSDFMKGF